MFSLEHARLGKGRALDAAIMRKAGQVMIMMIPPFLAEVQDDGEDTMRLVLTFYHLEMNRYGVIKWPPQSIYSTQEEYDKIERDAWQMLYRMWDDERVTIMHERFGRLVLKARAAHLTLSDSEEDGSQSDWDPERPGTPNSEEV